ncbi:MAP7 domain-containing protein 2-like [Palaemon carinicauda]|uniref:MAP7 domain-containing protein 2-like n=1 Tax=Palaemon carinicauda TaxID=392227 RepID=UPI0035B66FAD
MTSSVFDDPRTRESIRMERGRATLEELKQQVAEKEAAKRREKEEEDRIFAAMNAPTTYNPSFQEPNPRRRSQGYKGNVDQAATVEDTGGGGYYGGLGGGGYGDAGGYDDDYGGYDYSSGYNAPTAQPEYTAPKFYGGRRPQRFNANMTSEEREMVNRDRKAQAEGELQWQIQMKKQLDAERKKKEELEERLMEESIKKQQERMKMEYEAEMEKKRRKEEEQTRRRDAQLKHMEMIQSQQRVEKDSKMARARAAADLAASTPPTDSRVDKREIKPAQKDTPDGTPKETPNTGGRRRVPKKDEDFGLNLKTDSRFLAARQPNKFFDSPTTPVKMARTAEDRKRPKPMPEVPYTVTRQAAAGLYGPPKQNSRSYQGENNPPSKSKPSRPKTSLGYEHQIPAKPVQPPAPDILIVSTDSAGPRGNRGLVPSPPLTASSEVQTERVEQADIELQTTLALDAWEAERKHEEPRPAVVKGAPFDWRVKINGMSEEEKKKIEKETEEDIKHFKEENGDVMSQLTALKSGLQPRNSAWNPGGTGTQKSQDTKRTPQNNSRRSTRDSGFEQSRKTPTQSGGKVSGGYEPSFGKDTPTRSSRSSSSQKQPKSQSQQQSQSPEKEPQSQLKPESPVTIPSGKSEGVDYMRITTPKESDYSLPGTADTGEPEEEFPFDPDDTDGTTLRKFLARTAKHGNRTQK